MLSAEFIQRIAQAASAYPNLPDALQAIAENAVQYLAVEWLALTASDPLQSSPQTVAAGSTPEPVDTQQIIAFPIAFGDQTLGSLQVLPGQGRALTHDDEILCQRIADLAASAICIARLRQSEAFQRRQAKALRKVAHILNYSLERRQVLNVILEQLDQVIQYDSASIMLVADEQITIAAYRKFKFAEQLSLHGSLDQYPHIQEVVASRQPVIIHETHDDPRWKMIIEADYIRCWMGVPLVGRDRVIGLLNLDKEQPGFYTPQDIDLAMTFANQAALAIENAQLYQAARQAAERREILHQVSQKIVAASLEPEQIYTAIHHAASRLMPAEAFVITQYYEQKHLIEAVYMVDRSGRAPGQIIPEDRGLSSQVIRSGRSIYISDTRDVQKLGDVFHFGDPEEVRSALAVPMRLRGQVVGMLSAQCYNPNAYTVEDLYLLETLAAYAAIALDNASLFIHIQQLAITDALTGIFNRRHLFELGGREFLRARRFNRPLAAMMIDIDHFKTVNDTYGHDTGDEVLRKLCQLIKRNVREVDIISRYGGEEFAIILPEADLTAAREIAERLRRAVEQMLGDSNSRLPRITISLGITAMRADTPNLENLIHMADIALYAAKNAGRNRVSTH
jgi:diguanylate cyclase (GGDEF)-like protein